MKIAVIGCGVGGMAAAARLCRDGHQVSLIERFDTPAPLGAGLLIQPEGMTALDRLGVGKAARESGAEIDRLYGRTPARDGRAGRMVLDLRYADGRPGDIGIGLHRGALFSLLLDAALEAGAELVTGREITVIHDWDRPVLESAEGERLGPYDLVIIADGSQSALRPQVCPRARAPLYPWGAVWAVLPDPDGYWTARRELAQIYRSAEIMIGILPVGRDPSDAVEQPHVSFFWSLRHEDMAPWREAGLDAFREAIAACWPEAAALLAREQDLSRFAEASYRDVRVPRWRRGAVVLAGDAAHGTSPQLGQGANLAVNDALVLADCLADRLTGDAPLSRALHRYEKRRKPVTRFYVWMSWAMTPLFQSSRRWIGAVRDAVFGPLCRLPGIKQIMVWTLTGRGRLP